MNTDELETLDDKATSDLIDSVMGDPNATGRELALAERLSRALELIDEMEPCSDA